MIPNLVASVKGYLQFERETFKKNTQIGSQWMATSEIKEHVSLGNQLGQVLRRINLTYENYPELKSDKTVTRLMDKLAGTENNFPSHVLIIMTE